MEILPGDWWLIRKQKIPLPEQTIINNREEWLKKPAKKRSATWSTDITLGEISEKAAKFCGRLHCMHLTGLRQLLDELQIDDENRVLSPNQRSTLRERLDVPKGKPWNERLTRDLDRWTPDFIYKLGLLHGLRNPSPPTIDWASSMTWLTMTQAEIPRGTLPINYFLYTLCAMELCSDTESLRDDNSHQSPGQLLSFEPSTRLTHWQQRTLQNAHRYLESDRPLLNQVDINQLRLLVNHEPAQLFAQAADCSAKIHKTLLGWGIQL